MGAIRGHCTLGVMQQQKAPGDKLSGNSKKGSKVPTPKGPDKHAKALKKAGWPEVTISGVTGE